MKEMNKEDQLLRSLFVESETNNSIDFTEKVMHEIGKKPEVFIYKPPISNKAWVMIGVTLIGFFSFFIFQFEAIELADVSILNSLITSANQMIQSISFDLTLTLPELPTMPEFSVIGLTTIGLFIVIALYYTISCAINDTI